MRQDRVFEQDGKLILHKRTDPTPALEAVKAAKQAPVVPMSDSVHVGRIDKHVLEAWIKEAGVKFNDRAAVQEVIKRKLLDGDFAKFRVWEGSY